jgi:phosphopantetheinyl transferase
VALSVDPLEHGLDIQELRDKAVAKSLAQFTLTPEEMAFYEKNPHGDLFIKIWTMKEAYLKATGQGLGQELNSFSVLPIASGPRTMANGPVYFHLSAQPGALMALVSLKTDINPSIIDLNDRLSDLINQYNLYKVNSIPIEPIYTY